MPTRRVGLVGGSAGGGGSFHRPVGSSSAPADRVKARNPAVAGLSTGVAELLDKVERVFVLGIDPGLSCCGYGVVRRCGGHLTATTGGIVTTGREMPLPERLLMMLGELRALVAEVRPDAVVVERVFFQTNARTAMATGQAGGVALVAAAEAGCEVAQYTSNEVKMAVVGFGSATKDQVQRMVAALLDLPEPPRPPDVADAFALALCHLTAQPLRRAIEAASIADPPRSAASGARR